jgi:hypothetical protein
MRLERKKVAELSEEEQQKLIANFINDTMARDAMKKGQPVPAKIKAEDIVLTRQAETLVADAKAQCRPRHCSIRQWPPPLLPGDGPDPVRSVHENNAAPEIYRMGSRTAAQGLGSGQEKRDQNVHLLSSMRPVTH